MPVLKVKKNGVWEDIMGGSDSGSLNGGNADTLDGYHASQFAMASDVSDLTSAMKGKSDADHTHDDRYYTESEIDTKLANLTVSGGSVSAENVVGLNALLASKVDVVEGKGLSTNDYSDEEKEQLATMAELVGDEKVSTQIETAVANKADVNHTHSGYASSNHTHSGYASSGHTHSYNDLTNLPTSTNADTVDGYHASYFATATDLSNLENLVGDTSVSDQINTAISNISTSKTLLQHFTEENMVLTVLQYGDTLPSPGTPGRIFFKKVSG